MVSHDGEKRSAGQGPLCGGAVRVEARGRRQRPPGVEKGVSALIPQSPRPCPLPTLNLDCREIKILSENFSVL